MNRDSASAVRSGRPFAPRRDDAELEISVLAALLDPLIGFLFALPHLFLFTHCERRWQTPCRVRRGLVIVCGGIEGPSLAQHGIAGGLLRGGWRGAVHIFRWNTGIPFWRCGVNLMNRAYQQRRAAELAGMIREYTRLQPGRPIHLVAVSGGCWIVTQALELLHSCDKAPTVDQVILLAPAISPTADLSRAARAVNGQLHLFKSRFDFVMLGAGTTLLGTSDRRFGPAAGWRGLRNPPTNVCQHEWLAAFADHGNLGSHCTSVAPGFIRSIIAPLLRQK